MVTKIPPLTQGRTADLVQRFIAESGHVARGSTDYVLALLDRITVSQTIALPLVHRLKQRLAA